MLWQRVVTAVALLAVLLPALFAHQPWPFQLLTLVLIAAAGWEWGRLNESSPAGAWGFGALVAASCLALLFTARTPPVAAWWVAALFWAVGGAWALRVGPSAWPRIPRAWRWAIGFFALCVAWLAIAQARATGINFLLSVFALVWAADIAAYAGGRAFGRRKLAPTISPGKSWEGVFSGAIGVGLLAWSWIRYDQAMAPDSASLYSQLLLRWGLAGAAIALAALTALSVMGDLIESLVKRARGVKDSSGLLPGHGGVLDRVDALLPVFPAALALASL